MKAYTIKKGLMIAACLTAAIFLAPLFADQPPPCSVCKKNIRGSYFESKGVFFCSKKCVLASKPPCIMCGTRKLKGGFYWNKKYVCSQSCLNKARPKCAVCASPVVGGTGLTSGGKQYCSPQCFTTTLPSCNMCGKKIQEMLKTQGRAFCETCFNTPKCQQCSLPAGSSVLPDTRPFCIECKSKGITDPKTALKLYREVRKYLYDRIDVRTDERIRFHLVDGNELKRLSEHKETNENGLYKHVKTVTSTHMTLFGVNLVKDVNKKTEIAKDIYILNWLDAPNFRMVCAHELMHDWTQENFPDIKDERIVEGISEYAAYLLCKEYGYNSIIEKMVKNKDITYGAGFRLVKGADKGNDLGDVIKWLESGRYKTDLLKLDKKSKTEKPASK